MIKTSRLKIRLIELEDIESVRLLHNHPENLKWLSDSHEVSSIEQLNWYNKIKLSQTSRRYVLELADTMQLIGVFRLDNIDLYNKSAFVGLDIGLEFRRQGYAYETYCEMIPYLFSKFSLNRMSLITLSTNQAAIFLYEKLGFKKEGVLREAFYKNSIFLDGWLYSKLKCECTV